MKSVATISSICVKFLQTIGHIHSDIRLEGLGLFPAFGDEKNSQETEDRSAHNNQSHQSNPQSPKLNLQIPSCVQQSEQKKGTQFTVIHSIYRLIFLLEKFNNYQNTCKIYP